MYPSGKEIFIRRERYPCQMSIKKLPPALACRKAKKESSFKIIISDFSPDCNVIASRAGKKGRLFSKTALGGRLNGVLL